MTLKKTETRKRIHKLHHMKEKRCWNCLHQGKTSPDGFETKWCKSGMTWEMSSCYLDVERIWQERQGCAGLEPKLLNVMIAFQVHVSVDWRMRSFFENRLWIVHLGINTEGLLILWKCCICHLRFISIQLSIQPRWVVSGERWLRGEWVVSEWWVSGEWEVSEWWVSRLFTVCYLQPGTWTTCNLWTSKWQLIMTLWHPLGSHWGWGCPDSGNQSLGP